MGRPKSEFNILSSYSADYFQRGKDNAEKLRKGFVHKSVFSFLFVGVWILVLIQYKLFKTCKIPIYTKIEDLKLIGKDLNGLVLILILLIQGNADKGGPEVKYCTRIPNFF